MGAMAAQITSLTIAYLTVYPGADQRKHQSSASLAFVWGIHRWPVNSPHKEPVTRKMFPFDDAIMAYLWDVLYIRRMRTITTNDTPMVIKQGRPDAITCKSPSAAYSTSWNGA